MKPKPSVPIVCVSDWHANSTVGLCPPGIRLVDGGEYVLSNFQKWLWHKWLDFCEYIPRGAIVEVNGDMVQGIHASRDQQIITTSSKVQASIALAIAEPLRDKASAFYVIRGTGFHDNKGGDDIESIASQLDATRNDDTGEYSFWELWLRHDKLIHFAHHISVAPTYPMTPLVKESQEARRNSFDSGYPLPDLAVRSHIHQYHYYVDSVPNIVTTPAWQLKTEYLYKRRPQAISQIGGIILWINEKEIRIEPRLYPFLKPKILNALH